ncbi:unnamed protein product [Angiostrongylus costaricensis]|uniref:Eph LBD domain-containing protein n=1 Tax=Angiostrongylus costaricensis TaxID=334426 RepID=A0A0R3PTD8_ANGCS|nr:unnamed protein product [Angiostrongylus costaricensis]
MLIKCLSSYMAILVILMDTRSATTDLKWDQLSLRGDTDGWTEESWRGLDEKSNERAYVACSFHVANPGNWVFTPLIPRESANILYINVLYNTRSCDQYHDPKSCKETFNLYVKQYNRKVNDVDKETFNRTISTWSPVSVLTKDTTAEISETTQSVTLHPSTEFVRFGFEENGVCVSLLTITELFKWRDIIPNRPCAFYYEISVLNQYGVVPSIRVYLWAHFVCMLPNEIGLEITRRDVMEVNWMTCIAIGIRGYPFFP